MTFDQLDAFLAAVRSDTFFDAAESLHITQSALSKQILKLEKELDLYLFDRSGRSAVLTDAGRIFYEEAQGLSAQYHRALDRMQEFKTASRLSLRLGTLPVLSQYHLTGMLKDFSSSHPEIRLSMDELEEEDLTYGLKQGRFDLIIIRDLFLDQSEFQFYPLSSDRLVAVFPSDHPLAEEKTVSIEDIAGEPFVLMHPYTAIYRLCLSLFQDAGIRPDIVRTARMESILSAVTLHEGISLFAEENFNLFRHDSLVSVPLEPSPVLKTGVAVRKTGFRSPAAAEFLRFMRTEKSL
ncbi:MAG: LysR family transcriptional regulator [Lachnospiraceae bacterium]|nr:LysR family transcriptional regulator [Lachnospiraceae bacterium]